MISFPGVSVGLVGQARPGKGLEGIFERPQSQIGTGELALWLLIVAGGIGGVCAIIYLFTRLAHRRRYNSHASVFNGLCRAHDLDSGSRRLLKQLARHYRISQSARLFVEPKWLDPTALRGSWQARALDVATLRNRLFA